MHSAQYFLLGEGFPLKWEFSGLYPVPAHKQRPLEVEKILYLKYKTQARVQVFLLTWRALNSEVLD